MLNQNTSIHLFDFEGQKIAFNGNSYGVALMNDVGFSTISRYLKNENCETVNLETVTLDEKTCNFIKDDFLSSTTPKRLENTNPTRLDMLCLLVTSKCNLKCDYCFNEQGSYTFLPAENMDEKTAMNAVIFLLNHCGDHATISFFGGEPTLKFPFIKRIVEFSKEQSKNRVSLSFSIATNGTLITDEIAQFLQLHNFAIVYSIDGDETVHDYHRKFPHQGGSFHLTMKGAKKLLSAYGESQDKVVFRGTFTHQTKEFHNAYIQLVNNGFKNISIEPAVGKTDDIYAVKMSDLPELSIEYKKLAKDYQKIYTSRPDVSFFHLSNLLKNLSSKQKHDTPCGASTGYVTIAPNGDIYPCHRIVHPKYKMGNINEIPLDQPFVNSLQNEFYNATVTNREGCQNCWAKWLCGGSCYASNIVEDKNIHDQHPIDCELMKIRIEAAIWIFLQQELLKENLDADTILKEDNIKIFHDNPKPSQHATNAGCGFCEIIACQVSCESSCTASCTGGCTTSCEPFF